MVESFKKIVKDVMKDEQTKAQSVNIYKKLVREKSVKNYARTIVVSPKFTL
nr:MAG TPA: hypothetical protein [Caudoviricetes sp.]